MKRALGGRELRTDKPRTAYWSLLKMITRGFSTVQSLKSSPFAAFLGELGLRTKTIGECANVHCRTWVSYSNSLQREREQGSRDMEAKVATREGQELKTKAKGAWIDGVQLISSCSLKETRPTKEKPERRTKCLSIRSVHGIALHSITLQYLTIHLQRKQSLDATANAETSCQVKRGALFVAADYPVTS